MLIKAFRAARIPGKCIGVGWSQILKVYGPPGTWIRDPCTIHCAQRLHYMVQVTQFRFFSSHVAQAVYDPQLCKEKSIWISIFSGLIHMWK